MRNREKQIDSVSTEHQQRNRTRRVVRTMRFALPICLAVFTSVCVVDVGVAQAQSSEWMNSIGHVQKNTTIEKINSPSSSGGSSVAPTPSPTIPTSSVEPKLLWSDEFDATSGYNVARKDFPNPAIWDRDVGVGEWGWGNDEYQYYTDASTTNNAFVQDGSLHIVAREEYNNVTNTAFTSARLKTDQNMFVQYGTIVARIQIPNLADGLWAGFWTLGENFRQVGWPKSGEIDIMEIGDAYSLTEGNGNKRVISAVHMARANGTYYYNYTWTEARPVDLSLDYHLYTLEWTPTSIEMFVDDYRTHYFDIDMNICDACEELHQPHYLMFNLAVGGNYNLRQEDIRGPERITAPLPATMKIDYIRIYDNGYTNVYIPTSAPITASPTSAAPTESPTVSPTATPITAAPLATKSPTKNKPTPLRSPTSAPLKVSPNVPPTAPVPTTKAPQTMAPIEEKIFNTKAPTDPNATDKDFPSIVDTASKAGHSYYNILIVWMGVSSMFFVFQNSFINMFL